MYCKYQISSRINEITLDKFQSCAIIDVKWSVQMNQYQKTTEKKKQAIIQSALSLFKEKGFKETSIQSIAKVAEVSPVSIYNYFDKKDNLVALCINELFKDIIQEAENILLSNIDYKSKLNQALALCQKKISQQISNYFQEKTLEDPTFTKLMTKAIDDKKREIYRAYIELGKNENIIAKDLSTEVILNVMSALNSTGNHLSPNKNIEDETKQIHHILLYGILTNSRTI